MALGCVLSVASPAAAAASQVHLRAGAEPEAGQVTRWDYGQYGDRHLLCDWDGDGDATLGLYRPTNATWYVRQSGGGGNAQLTFRYGRPGVGDRVLCGDWDGDGDDTPGLFRAADNSWHLRNTSSAGAADVSFRYGRPASGDTPLVGDWDGDGDDTPGVFRSSDNVWYLRDLATAGDANATFRYGRPGASDSPLVGDWDGDDIDTPGIFRAADRTLHLRNSNSGGPATWSYPFGVATDRPLSGDWDADGRDEPALAREFPPVQRVPGTACSADAPRYSHEDSAKCFYLALVRGDRAMAANYVTPAVAADLVWDAPAPRWTFEGCGAPEVTTPSSGVACGYYDPEGASEAHGLFIEFAMSRDLRVEGFGSIG